MIKRWNHFIDGNSIPPTTNTYLDIINPATGKVIAEAANGCEKDTDLAVSAAKNAFENSAWRDFTLQDRSKLLAAISQLLLQNLDELANLDVQSCGGTISRMKNFDLPAAADIFRYYAEAINHYPFVEHPVSRPLPEVWNSVVTREPVGVCALITAWNAPILLLAMKLAPALAAGCTVVIKPSELTPTSTLRIAELLSTLLPAGVVNVVNGIGSVVGERLSLHPDVRKISFTGSTRIGTQIQVNAALTTKRVTLEMGGKGPALVLADANMPLTTRGAAFGVLLNSGQACESGTRLLVHESVHDELISSLSSLMQSLTCGDPSSPNTGIGAISSKAHLERIQSYIDSAKNEGAVIACGGERAVVPGCEDGFYFKPTLITNVNNDMKVAREEIFGPVLCVIKYSDINDAIKMANDTQYGLSAGIWTTDIAYAQSLAKKLHAGSVWINDWHMIRSDLPFGGFKQSGIGRELGAYALDSYVELKAVTTAFESNPERKALHTLVLK
jgi:aldehyde dehydrogenase (NAD+)